MRRNSYSSRAYIWEKEVKNHSLSMETYRVIIIWRVSRSRQHSRRYITAEDKDALKIRHTALLLKCKKCWRAKSRKLGEKIQMLTGRHWRHGREKRLRGTEWAGHSIKTWKTEKLTWQRAIKWPCVRWVWPIRRRGKKTSKRQQPLGTRRPWTKERV